MDVWFYYYFNTTLRQGVHFHLLVIRALITSYGIGIYDNPFSYHRRLNCHALIIVGNIAGVRSPTAIGNGSGGINGTFVEVIVIGPDEIIPNV